MEATSAPKPEILKPDLDAIPAELKGLSQWVTWRLEMTAAACSKCNGAGCRKCGWTGKRFTKRPYNPANGRRASHSDPKTWGTYEQAVNAYRHRDYDGVGFVFAASDPYAGVDLDDCRDPETGAIEPWAALTIEQLNGYAEVSPSGCGVKIVVKGALPPGRRRKEQIEMYDRERFFTLTGHRVEL